MHGTVHRLPIHCSLFRLLNVYVRVYALVIYYGRINIRVYTVQYAYYTPRDTGPNSPRYCMSGTYTVLHPYEGTYN